MVSGSICDLYGKESLLHSARVLELDTLVMQRLQDANYAIKLFSAWFVRVSLCGNKLLAKAR